MAKTQTLKINFTDTTTNKKYSKSFSDLAANTIGSTEDAKSTSAKYAKIVAGDFTSGSLSTVEPFDA